MLDILIFIILILNAVLGLVIFFRNRKAAENLSYALFVIFLDIWIATNYLENEPGIVGVGRVATFLRLDFVFGALFMYAWFRFCVEFAARGGFRFAAGRWLERGAFGIALLFAPLTLLSDLVIRDISFGDSVIHFADGPLWPFYALFVLACAAAGVAFLVFARRRALQKADFLFKRTAGIILAGFLLSLGNAIAINLLQPVLNISLEASRLGLYGLTILVLCTAYAIIRYQFLNVKVIVVETLVICLVLLLFLQFWAEDFPHRAASQALLLFGTTVAGAFLIRGVRREVRIREQSQLLAARFRELSDMKTQLLSFISHQLKSPLAIMKGYVNLVIEEPGGKLSSESKDMLGKASKAADDLVKLVDEVLDLRRVDEGKMEYHYEKVEAAELVRSLAEEMRPLVIQRGLHFEVRTPETPLWIRADAQKLSQAVRNLIDNALKYTSVGSITVEVGKKGSWATMKITDSGIGIPKELIPHLFEEFVRDARIQAKIHGSGIGLYIARKITEAHGGTIAAESYGEGQGSIFTISLPLYK